MKIACHIFMATKYAKETTLRRILTALIFLIGYLLLPACNEALDTSDQDSGGTDAEATLSATDDTGDSTATGDDTAVTAIAITANDDAMSGYAPSSFSRYIYLRADDGALLVDFNFFPSGTDFDSQNKRAVLPCDTANDGADDELLGTDNASAECDNLSVDLAEATFTFVGMTFPGGSTITAFAEDFEFTIGNGGFTDTADSAVLSVSADSADLATVYGAVLAKR